MRVISSRVLALSLAREATGDNPEISGWAHEMRTRIALTTGDYRGTLAASQAGTDASPKHGVAVQLAAESFQRLEEGWLAVLSLLGSRDGGTECGRYPWIA
ncbi:hypothetical protein ACIA8E_29875 [Streptomyces sp. NPDC051664]|uniref:hypothetical protein n=1 Tax=Streptomyces sp. NPDC051664 TaxID=3365668 RepID=UPI0037A5264E